MFCYCAQVYTWVRVGIQYIIVNRVEIFRFLYYQWHQNTLHYIQRELEWAHQTAVDCANFCREVAIEFLLTKSERIGGPGKVVEIDKS